MDFGLKKFNLFLQSACLKDIDYVYICFCFQGNNDRFEVVAARPKSIENDLKKQGFNIYNYINTDSDTQASVSSKGFTKYNDQFTFEFENNISTESPEVLVRNVFNDAFRVMKLRTMGEPYITTELVQNVVDVIEPYLNLDATDTFL